MRYRNGFSGFFYAGFLTFFFSGLAYGQDSLITQSSPGLFSINQDVLAQMARDALHLPFGRRMVLRNPPRNFQDYGDPPTGGRVTVESMDSSSGVIHMAVEIQNGAIVSEVLYFDAMIPKRSVAREALSPGGGEIEETLVRSGDEVRIQAKGPGFEISLPGIAQNDGGLGDLVTVVNSRSGARLRGKVSGADRIVVEMADLSEKSPAGGSDAGSEGAAGR
ncbi:MAG: flagella basal body P-ring formation protein FlgA [Nitrospiraceae bacterium]|jgi:flagella basal body P-ring formation protein FlgA|nr:flagella basal body P-ring formation protein FlgA [Nitrospiraceae bacterium]